MLTMSAPTAAVPAWPPPPLSASCTPPSPSACSGRGASPTRRLAAADTPLATLDHQQLGIIAGQLRRTRCRHAVPADLATGSYGLLRAGTITVTTGSGQPLTLSPAPPGPRTTRFAAPADAHILIHVDAHEIHQLISHATSQ